MYLQRKTIIYLKLLEIKMMKMTIKFKPNKNRKINKIAQPKLKQNSKIIQTKPRKIKTKRRKRKINKRKVKRDKRFKVKNNRRMFKGFLNKWVWSIKRNNNKQ